MKSKVHWTLIICLIFASTMLEATQNKIVAKKILEGPIIDGLTDGIWNETNAIKIKDPLTEKIVSLKSLYDKENLYFLVSYPDKTESREHKPLLWDDSIKMYKNGPAREDTFIFKWNIQGSKIDLSLQAEAPYIADIWYWKGFRTDPVGYADDKRHIYSQSKRKKTKKMISKSGKIFYLSRPADSGKAAYEGVIYTDIIKQSMPKYKHQSPSSSRSDILAKGAWSKGTWTIEFKRKLDTAHQDDVNFNLNKKYHFGISIHEIAGRELKSNDEHSNHGSGKISNLIQLSFEK